MTDLDFPTFFFLNKNCLLKFDISILSLSVTVNLEFLSEQNPIIAKFFKNSQPVAPAPTIKILFFLIFS